MTGNVWLSGRVLREPDLQSTGRGFDIYTGLRAPERKPGQVVYTRTSVTKQYNLVPANGWY